MVEEGGYLGAADDQEEKGDVLVYSKEKMRRTMLDVEIIQLLKMILWMACFQAWLLVCLIKWYKPDSDVDSEDDDEDLVDRVRGGSCRH